MPTASQKCSTRSKRGRPCNAVLVLVRRTRWSILTAGLSDNDEEFELEDTNMELTEEIY